MPIEPRLRAWLPRLVCLCWLAAPALPAWSPARHGTRAQAATRLDDDRAPVPPSTEVQAEREKLRAELDADYRQLDQRRRRALATKLLEVAVDREGAALYGALAEALDLAADAFDVTTTGLALDRLVARFEVDELEFRVATWTRFAPQLKTSGAEEFGQRLLALLERCIDAGRFTLARGLLDDAGKVFLARSKNNHEQRTALRELEERLEHSLTIAGLEQRLAADPNDPDVCLALGRHYAFELGDLARGFPLLARGTDEVLRALVSADVATPREAVDCFELAERWRSFAAADPEPDAQRAGFTRAKRWYESALKAGLPADLAQRANRRLADEARRLLEVAARDAPAARRPANPGAPSARAGAPRQAVKAVDLGVGWLLSTQTDGGDWDCGQNEGWAGHSVGVTGLALLALMASEHDGVDAALGKGLAWLCAQQAPPTLGKLDSGRIGAPIGHAFLYDHAIATLALCEALRTGRSPSLVGPCTAAVRYIERARNPDGAWRYDFPPIGDNDTSVTGWMVLALRTAEEAGITVDPGALAGALAWVVECTYPGNGRCGYDAMGSTSSRVEGRNDDYPMQGAEAMTAVALHVRLALGQTEEGTRAIRQHVELLAQSPPRWEPKVKANDMYYWYHGALAMHAYARTNQRDKAAPAWLDAVQDAFLVGQNQRGEKAGSWDPIGPWGWAGGRVYSTSVAILSLTTIWR